MNNENQPQKKILGTVRNVTRNFQIKGQEVKVLKGVDLDIYEGELLLILGPSGSGKSTLLNALIGLDDFTSGQVNFCGVDISNASENDLIKFRKDNIGIIYQQSIWIKSLDVITNVAFPLTLKGVPKHEALEKAYQMLDLVGMRNWAKYSPVELSSGQQQKIALARSLISDPKVIIADEPTGNLDYASGQELAKTFQRLVQEGKTIIMITHDLENVAFATRIIRMFDGRIIENFQVDEKNIASLKDSLVKQNLYRTSRNMLNPNAKLVTEFAENLEKKQQEKLEQEFETKTLKRNFKKFVKNFVKGVIKSISPKSFFNTLKGLLDFIAKVFRVTTLVIITFVYRAIYHALDLRFWPNFISNFRFKLTKIYMLFEKYIVRRKPNQISFADLLSISIKNIFAKKSRTFVTVGGVGIGIGFTVFLISIGFGIERLVINRVAGLEELKQIEVLTEAFNDLKINDETVANFEKLNKVDQVLPVITLAGKASYENANTDIVVIGVQADYLTKSDLVLTKGEYFDNNEITALTQEDKNRDSLVVVDPNLGATASVLASEEPGEVTEEEEENNIQLTYLPDNATKKIVANKAFLNLLNINENDAIGKQVDLSFIATEEILDEDIELQTYNTPFEIVAVISNFDNPQVYVPIVDLRLIGINNYSQAKIVTDGQSSVADVRTQIETDGFRTKSVLDTISQIQDVFSTARTVFTAVGLIALVVASFGMFNTLTISLLERTREVGLMKAIGMSSNEVKDLFLTESVTMGLMGGFTGILIGLLGGIGVSYILTALAVSRGFESIDISYLPFFTGLQILFASALVGIVTGFYPATRATKITPVQALRYE